VVLWINKFVEEEVLKAVNLGHDADTVGAICGQIAGAFYGIQGIPTEWLNVLYQVKQIQKIAVHLFEKRLSRT
jgi:ADP-ribosyl-[dinitrogen reductase] hydrolase